jgi:hypothetical protein
MCWNTDAYVTSQQLAPEMTEGGDQTFFIPIYCSDSLVVGMKQFILRLMHESFTHYENCVGFRFEVLILGSAVDAIYRRAVFSSFIPETAHQTDIGRIGSMTNAAIRHPYADADMFPLSSQLVCKCLATLSDW